MAISTTQACFTCEAAKVWRVVTSLTEYAWRSDIKRIEVLEEGKKFAEYTQNDFPTFFTITAFEPLQRYEFDMENENMYGRWKGVFSYADGVTTITFTEDVHAKKFFMRPFVSSYLKKQQKLYMQDLQKALAAPPQG